MFTRRVSKSLTGSGRAVPGHWEGDLLLGRHWSQIATVVERTTRYTVLVHVTSRGMDAVSEGLSREMAKLPETVRRTLTWDRGMELANHPEVTKNNVLAVFFADPRSPWQRGTNENTNRLQRQYFPKGMSLAALTQDELSAVAVKLNTRPRKTLGSIHLPNKWQHCCVDPLNLPPHVLLRIELQPQQARVPRDQKEGVALAPREVELG